MLDANGNLMSVGEVYLFSLTLGGLRQEGSFPTDDQSRDTLFLSQFSFSSKNVGDINLDGYDDLLVGALGAKETSQEARAMGAAFMYLGGEFFPNLTPVVRFDPRVSDQDDSVQFGNAVGGVGDINGDGVEDFAIGAPRQDDNIRRNSGMVYLYFGGKNPTDAPNQNFARERDASVGNSFGTGDVNGDGFYDLITAARGDHLNATDATRSGAPGSSFVDIRFGGVNGIEVLSDQKIEDPDTELFDIDGEGTGYPARVDFVIENVDDQGSGAGGSISVGDFNGDGYDDLCFPAFAKDLVDENGNRTLSVGAVWIYPGSANGIDVSKRIELRPTGNSTFYGILAEMNKDLNGDGYDDLIVGSIDLVNSKSIIEVYLGGEGETIDTTPDIRLELGMVYLNGEDSV